MKNLSELLEKKKNTWVNTRFSRKESAFKISMEEKIQIILSHTILNIRRGERMQIVEKKNNTGCARE